MVDAPQPPTFVDTALADVETLHLDRGYDYGAVKACAANHGIDDVVCAKRRKPGAAASKTTVPLGLRWAIERTNSWLSNFGQLRRNTDRRPRHRLAQLALAIALLLTAKLIDWRNRWSLVSGGREPPPPALLEPYVTVSRHTAPTVRRSSASVDLSVPPPKG